MPNIIMSKSSNKLEPSLKKKAYAFLEKLTENDASPGLHIEPIHNSVDQRVRTGRVDDFFRAVLFKITGAAEPTYVFHGIWPHDDAIALAKKTTLTVNPVNGITEIRTVEPTSETTYDTPAEAPREPPVVEAVDDAPHPVLDALGITSTDLVDLLGIDRDLADAALAATTEDHLLEIAGGAVEWQGLALIDLASGHNLAEVRERLALDQPVEASTNDDEAILRGLDHAAAKLSFTYIESNDELRRAIDEGDFGSWRVFLHPEQRRYVTGRWKGPFRLSGGAGTGKTVVVLHRARSLARSGQGRRVIVTTYTTNLADAMKRDLYRLDPQLTVSNTLGDPGVYVAGIDALAARVLKHAGEAGHVAAAAVLGAGARVGALRPGNARWNEVLDIHGDELPTELRSASFLDAEYATVVLPAQITTEAEYLKVRRPGRGVSLDRARRRAVWRVIAAYRNHGALDRQMDFDEAAAVAAEHLNSLSVNGSGYVADHVLVDEGQDLTPSRWRLLRALAGPEQRPDDLFIAEDSHQRIYGQKVVLSRYGIAIVGRSRRLTLNYRTTAQNLAFALGVLAPGTYTDLDDEQEKSSDYRSARSGPVPSLRACTGIAEEYDHAADTIKGWLAGGVVPDTIAVLVRDRLLRDKVVAALGERGVGARAVDREEIKGGMPVVMTMHRSKGTEFSRVLLFGMSESSIPAGLRSEKYSESSWNDAILRERSLLYVASTRARDELAVSWSGVTSPLLA
ncbi:3'-5' exonuclease [Sanguibacter suaedae]|uniref:DNA 3'-5' helicase n=1 Tax=Sanguibacter suaedae TaxID=2795737 RepID=A0A934I3M2_9MICO|nr:3'-5' exonuclease [Sanguibacter suaedae]MBI9114979.1 DEAD/DEAH box helicase [Sanguibacter suaedae]